MNKNKLHALDKCLAGEWSLLEGAQYCGMIPSRFRDFCWRSVKAKVAYRDGGLCRYCGQPGTDVHHRRARGMGGTWDSISVMMPGLILLCRKDHSYYETHPDLAREVGLRLDAGDDPVTVPVTDIFGSRVFLEVDGTVVHFGQIPGQEELS